MRVYVSELRAAGFMGTDENYPQSDYFLMGAFKHFLQSIGADVKGRPSSMDDHIDITDVDDPNTIFQMLRPNSPWQHYMAVSHKQVKDAILYQVVNYFAKGIADKMCLFDSGGSYYAAFTDKAEAMTFKLTLE